MTETAQVEPIAADAVDSLLARCSFPATASVSCAVSGGADSMALMLLAVASGREVTAFHVDHGLRPDSHAEADVVAEVATRFGASVERRRVELEDGANLEERARVARHAALPHDVLFGHTADDQAETVVLNLLRGSGPDGLAAITPDRHPILGLRRSDTVGLCAALDVRPVDDPSNASAAFRRNRVRAEVIPLLNEITGTDVVPSLARSAEHQRDAAQLIDDLAAEVDETDARAVAALAPIVAGAVMRRWWRAATGEGHPPDRAAVTRMLDVASGVAVGADIVHGWQIRRTDSRLRLERLGDPQ